MLERLEKVFGEPISCQNAYWVPGSPENDTPEVRQEKESRRLCFKPIKDINATAYLDSSGNLEKIYIITVCLPTDFEEIVEKVVPKESRGKLIKSVNDSKNEICQINNSLEYECFKMNFSIQTCAANCEHRDLTITMK